MRQCGMVPAASRTTKPLVSCRACYSCLNLSHRSGNLHHHRRPLRYRSESHKPLSAASKRLRGQNRSLAFSSRSNVVASLTATYAEKDSDSIQAGPDPTQVQGFAGLGAQRTLDFLAAWDQLALRLPPQAGMGSAAELILNALKLAVSHPVSVPDAQGLPASTTASKAMSTALQLADLSGQGFPLDAESIAAGVLVDAVAGKSLALRDVSHALGPAVADLIESILKIRRLPSRVDLYDDVASSALRELALTFYDTRAIVVELVSRLVGMNRLVGTSLWARQLAALEALQIYAPLGHGLGLRSLSSQLEDSSFQELFPESYAETAAWLRREVNAHGDSLASCEQQLQQAVEADPEFRSLAAGCEVAGRTKSLFSTMKKLLRLDSMQAGGRSRQDLHDILASRCIVLRHPHLAPSQAEALATQACYVVARVAREMYEELPGRSKDYIQEPKGNGYQSLHCTIKLPPVTVECDTTGAAGNEECVLDQGPTCELQIRTQGMHELAESGGAAHAAYKGGLDAVQATRLQAWTRTLQALPPANPPIPEAAPQEWGNQAAAAEQLFTHLDRNGDGLISVEEVAVLLDELGVDSGVSSAQMGAQSGVPSAQLGAQSGVSSSQQGVESGVPSPQQGGFVQREPQRKLLAGLTDKQQDGVNFSDFLHFNHQANLLALPQVDTETAHSLRRSLPQQSSASAEESHTVPDSTSLPSQGSDSHISDSSLALTSTSSTPSQTLKPNKVESQDSSATRGSLASTSSIPSTSLSPIQVESQDSSAADDSLASTSNPSSSPLHGNELESSIHERSAVNGMSASAWSADASTSYQPLMSISHTGRAQSLASSRFAVGTSNLGFSGSRAGLSTSSVACACHSSRQGKAIRAFGNSPSASRAFGNSPSASGAFANSHSASRGQRFDAQSHSVKTQAVQSQASTSQDQLAQRRASHDQASTSTSTSYGDSFNSSSNGSSRTSQGSWDRPHDSDSPSSSPLPRSHSTTQQQSFQSNRINQSSRSHGRQPSIPPSIRRQSAWQQSIEQQPAWEQSIGQQSAQRQSNKRDSQSQQQQDDRTISLDLDQFPTSPVLQQQQQQQPPPQAQQPLQQAPQWGARDPVNGAGSASSQHPDPVEGSTPSDMGGQGNWDNSLRPQRLAQPQPRDFIDLRTKVDAADLLASGQSRQFDKDISYADATFCLVPLVSQIGWRLECDEEALHRQVLHLPMHGPILFGTGDSRQGPCDIILAVAAGDRAHARLELFWKGPQPCCLVTSLKPNGNTYINRSRVDRMTDIECYLGDVISFGEHDAAFMFMPILLPERQQSALANAVHYAQEYVGTDTVPRASSIVAAQVRVLARKQELAQARTLLATHLVYQEAFNEEGWGQLAYIEREIARRRFPRGSISAARCYYRAAAEVIQQKLDENASFSDDEEEASQQYNQLVEAVVSFIRVMSSWAQMEFDTKNETSARRLYRRALEALPKNPPLPDDQMQHPIKLLFKWAHLEYKSNNIHQARELLHALLQFDPTNFRGLSMLGTVEWAAGNTTLAREHLTAALEANPKFVTGYQTLGRFEAEAGDVHEARRLYSEGQGLEPDNVQVMHAWALFEASQGNSALARQMMSRACELQPRSVPCWHAAANLEKEAGNGNKSRELYLKALSLDPVNVLTYSALGCLERLCGNLETAMQYIDKALSLNAKHTPALTEKSVLLKKMGKLEAAVRWSDMAFHEKKNLLHKIGPYEDKQKQEMAKKLRAEAQGIPLSPPKTTQSLNKSRRMLRRKRGPKSPKNLGNNPQEASQQTQSQGPGPLNADRQETWSKQDPQQLQIQGSGPPEPNKSWSRSKQASRQKQNQASGSSDQVRQQNPRSMPSLLKSRLDVEVNESSQ